MTSSNSNFEMSVYSDVPWNVTPYDNNFNEPSGVCIIEGQTERISREWVSTEVNYEDDNAWFWSEEWQAKEAEADEEIERGEYPQNLTWDQLKDQLDSLKKSPQ